jgi:hypothetical protein
MHLLVTNAQEIQAHSIVCALRSHARRVVVTQGGASVRVDAFPGMAYYSRWVDARHEVPHFAADWNAGRLGPDNSPAEEAWVRRIEEIVRQEEIDTIVPSLDPEVFVLAKNRSRLLEQGVTVVAPDLEALRVTMDKARTLEAACRVGFPIPPTHDPDSPAAAAAIGATGGPWIVKPRFGAHGVNVRYVERGADLEQAWRDAAAEQPRPLVQEYVPGAGRHNYYLTIDRDGEILALFSPRVTRTHSKGIRVGVKSAISSTAGPLMSELKALVRELGLSGSFTVQTKIDERDSIPRLLEINPRFGHHLWFRTELGVNEPLMCVQLARGQPQSSIGSFPEGVWLLDPFHDLFHLVDTMISMGRRSGEAGPVHRRDSVRALLATYRREYLNRNPKIFCPPVRYLMRDPYPCLRAFAFKFYAHIGRPATRLLGGRIRA